MANRKDSEKPNACDPRPMALSEDTVAVPLAELAWAISHPARIKIIKLLIRRRNCVCGEIVAEFPLAQSTVSQHLKILKQSGLIEGEIEGPKVCYRINQTKLLLLTQLVSDLVGLGSEQ